MREAKYQLGDLFLIKHREDIMIGIELYRKEKFNKWWLKKGPIATKFTHGAYVKLTKNELKKFTKMFLDVANENWKNFKPKKVDSNLSDYKVYGKKYNTQFSCRINENFGKFNLYIEGFPNGDNGLNFNKRVAESFAFDLARIIDRINKGEKQ